RWLWRPLGIWWWTWILWTTMGRIRRLWRIPRNVWWKRIRSWSSHRNAIRM
ncbi:hypothetical protein ANCDUO_17615, partial [Ancylostoma duodenale]